MTDWDWRLTPEQRRAKLYEAEMGAEAMARNEERRETTHGCCWEAKDGPHHPVCPNFEDPPDEPLEGQTVLA